MSGQDDTGSNGAERQAQLLADAGRYLAGGGLGLFVLPPDVNIVVQRGEGSHVFDVAGREFIDYHLGSGPSLLGHGHPAITAAAAEQLPKGTSYYFLNEHTIRLARRLSEAAPCGGVCHFTLSGTEATFYAQRVARAYTGRQLVLKFEGAWHGMHDYGLWGTAPSKVSDYPSARPDSAGIPEALARTVLVAPYNDVERTRRIIEHHAREIAVVMVEPLQRVLRPDPGFLEFLRDITRRYSIVLMFDEIVTGFRIAWGGAQEVYGVVPDLATYGKAMSGGLPLAALVGSPEVMSVLDARRTERSRMVWATHTLSTNPVSAAAANAALDVLSQPGVFEHLHRIGSKLRAGFKEAGARHGFTIQTPGEDAVFGVRFTERETLRTWEDLLTSDKELGLEWAIELLRRGLLVNPNEKFYISIAHDDADVERTLEIVDASFAAMRARR